jgi:hypothetical protein
LTPDTAAKSRARADSFIPPSRDFGYAGRGNGPFARLPRRQDSVAFNCSTDKPRRASTVARTK